MSIILQLHNVFRWIVLLLGVLVLLKTLLNWLSKKPFDAFTGKLSSFFSIAMDINFIIGAVLWFYGLHGYKLLQSMGSMSAVMKNKVARFFVMEHPLMMILALVLVHLSRIGLRNEKISDAKKNRKIMIYTLCILLLFYMAIPWPWRVEIGRSLGL